MRLKPIPEAAGRALYNGNLEKSLRSCQNVAGAPGRNVVLHLSRAVLLSVMSHLLPVQVTERAPGAALALVAVKTGSGDLTIKLPLDDSKVEEGDALAVLHAMWCAFSSH